MPTIFFGSYARDDNDDLKLRAAVKYLTDRIASNLGLDKKEAENVVFFDAKDIKTGKDWEERLGEAVRTAPLLVCLCSPRYLGREYCAKEFEVFGDGWSWRVRP